MPRLADYRRHGSGKTRSGITPLLYQVFQNEPNWGGLCIDDKGIYWETLSGNGATFLNRGTISSYFRSDPTMPPLTGNPLMLTI